MTARCPACARELEVAHITATWRGVLPWHRIPGTVVSCPGSEAAVPLRRPEAR